MVYAHLVVVLGWVVVASNGLHFYVFCHSKHLKMFPVKCFIVKLFTCKIFYIKIILY